MWPPTTLHFSHGMWQYCQWSCSYKRLIRQCGYFKHFATVLPIPIIVWYLPEGSAHSRIAESRGRCIEPISSSRFESWSPDRCGVDDVCVTVFTFCSTKWCWSHRNVRSISPELKNVCAHFTSFVKFHIDCILKCSSLDFGADGYFLSVEYFDFFLGYFTFTLPALVWFTLLCNQFPLDWFRCYVRPRGFFRVYPVIQLFGFNPFAPTKQKGVCEWRFTSMLFGVVCYR